MYGQENPDDMCGQENPDDAWLYQHSELHIFESLLDIILHEQDDVSWLRREVEGIAIETSVVMNLDAR